MLDELISRGDREIVETSPTDKIWGIGLGLMTQEFTINPIGRGQIGWGRSLRR